MMKIFNLGSFKTGVERSVISMRSIAVVCLTVLLIAISAPAFSQDEFRIQIGQEIPLGALKKIYQPAASISLEYGHLQELRKGFNELGIGLKFFRFAPKASTFYYLIPDTSQGTATYSNYKFFQLYVTYRRIFVLTEKIDFFFGGNLGYSYVIYSSEVHEPGATVQEKVLEGKGTVIPTIGLSYKLTEKLGISLQCKYNLYFSLGRNEDSQQTNYNPNLGAVNYFWTNDLGIHFRF